jgi:nickel/cobalt exporter
VLKVLMLRRLLAPLALLLLLLATQAGAADYFGRPDPGPNATASQVDNRPPPSITLPAPLRAVLGEAVAMQSRLNAELRGHLRAARDDRSGGMGGAAVAIVLFSFLYGVLHAIGPGHGKLVVGSYFLTRQARLLHGLSMSLSAAMAQAFSAIVLVGVLAALFDVSTRRILDHAAMLESISYAAIAALGLWMGWGVISGRVCCDAHGHEHEQHGTCCDGGHSHMDVHGHDHGHDHGHVHGTTKSRRADWWHVLSTGAAVGLRPCSGAILVLLFTLANGIFAVGVIATFAMALGVAATVALVSLGTLGLNRWLSRIGDDGRGWAMRVRKLATLGGALLITAFGLLQLLGIWAGVVTPMAG